MIALAPWQGLLDGLGWVIAQIYDLIPNYGVTIILLTVVIRLVLLPLGIKQIRSMQHMQLVQPKVKAVQQKYKQNKTKQQEEIMKLYKEYGVNPFSGCWPVLLQFPILIAMYSVVRHPQHPVHIPADSALYRVIQQQIPEIKQPPTLDQVPTEPGPSSGTSFLGMNLLCSATQAGNPDAQLGDRIKIDGKPVVYPVNCGDSAVDRIPYYVFAVLMFGTTYFQQRQMQQASPPGAASQQQQALMKFMPLMFGVFGVFFPAGLVLYWTTSNAWQIGQQYFMLKSRPTAEQLAERAAKNQQDKAGKRGFIASLSERAAEERKRREQATGHRPATGQQRKPGAPRPSSGKPTTGKGPAGKGKPKPKPDTGESGGTDPGQRPER
ncbi:MAG TPA: YidC/Oxa1 family membrane protein insertase [Solirubrobacterales bacterium]|nr:YidC/Oxa1 family membrane protein insertase [Solirubrobacterales bacterium]